MEKTIGAKLAAALEALERLRAGIRDREIRLHDEGVREAQALIDLFGVRPEELRFPVPGRPAGPRGGNPDGSQFVRPVHAVVYRGPGGRTWTGLGVPPAWVKAHLASGGSLEDCRTGSRRF